MRPFQMPRLVPSLAFDRAEPREFTPRRDLDGRLHCKAHLTRAMVCGYVGREIPSWQALGLERERSYRLLRDPGELSRAASTFNALPILSKHSYATAKDHKPDLVIGATGSDAEFNAPFLDCSIVVWSGDDIAEIEDDNKAELSASYRYRADMTPGAFEGESFDGVMRDIIGQHIACVVDGRSGPTVRIGDPLATDARPLNAEAAFRQQFPEARAPRRL